MRGLVVSFPTPPASHASARPVDGTHALADTVASRLARLLALDAAMVEAEARRQVLLDRLDPDEMVENPVWRVYRRGEPVIARWQEYAPSVRDGLARLVRDLKPVVTAHVMVAMQQTAAEKGRPDRRGDDGNATCTCSRGTVAGAEHRYAGPRRPGKSRVQRISARAQQNQGELFV